MVTRAHGTWGGGDVPWRSTALRVETTEHIVGVGLDRVVALIKHHQRHRCENHVLVLERHEEPLRRADHNTPMVAGGGKLSLGVETA